jgi:CBS-domain-containing membrane protein
MKVSEVMVRDVLTAEPGTELRRVAAMMIEKDVSGIPVVDGSGRLLGLVGELDLVQRHTRLEPPAFFPVLDARIPLETPSHYEHRLRHLLGTRAEEVMETDPPTTTVDEELEDVAARMVDRRASTVPVLDGDRVVVGVVSAHDLVRTMARETA